MSNDDIFAVKYRAMYRAMIEKNGTALNELLESHFALVHMTGMRQNKREFIRAVETGTLNYFSEDLQEARTIVHKDFVQFTGKSIVDAAVFGGGRHTWRLQLDVKFVFVDGDWLISETFASTW
ncbi:MAG: nuclear transport factor 2 family protein [Clostridiales bacterium]|nr:nuclear transport factor 2 family protein [Clostridiales bacterium]